MNAARTVAIVGAGKLGTTLARMFVATGHRTILAGRSDPAVLGLVVGAVVPGAEAMAVSDAVAASDIAILALPLHRIPELPPVFSSIVTIDATNYWEPTDGALPSFVDPTRSLSESVRDAIGAGHLVKTFNHVGYHDLDLAFEAGTSRDPLAIGVAGDDLRDTRIAAELVADVGFAPVLLPSLAAGRVLEAGHPLFGAPVTAREMIAQTEDAVAVAVTLRN